MMLKQTAGSRPACGYLDTITQPGHRTIGESGDEVTS